MRNQRAIREGQAALATLAPITSERVTNVLPELEHAWSERSLQLHQRAQEAIEQGDHFAAQRWHWCAGVATDKVLLLKGRPTEIVGHLHAHRHELGPLMDRLAGVMRSPQPAVVTAVGRVAYPHQVGDKRIQVIEPRYDAPPQPNAAPGHELSK